MGYEPPRPVDLAEEEGCYHALLLVKVEAAVLGGELFCQRCGDDAGALGHLFEGTYNGPQDPAPLPMGAELGIEAAAQVSEKLLPSSLALWVLF